MSDPLKPRNELKLGLSLSGGGVRSVGFHLGTLDALERLDLLKQVNMLSTVSGGSLVGIGYALYLKIGAQLNPPKTFSTFFNDFFDFLPQLDTMVELIDGMDVQSQSGHRTMVGAMARVYRDHYFQPCYGDPKFGVFWDPALPDIHLKDMMFHASDFKTGLAFRFQYNESEKNNPNNRNIGNDQVYLVQDHARQLYLSDIMTTSACLPGLLEPMFMPQDYRLSDKLKDDIRTHFHANCFVEFDYVALMDGGMLDNQGVSSILMALIRNQADPPAPVPPAFPLPVSPWDYSVRWRSRIWADQDYYGKPVTELKEKQVEPADPIPVSAEPLPGLARLGQALSDLDLLIISDTPSYNGPRERFFPKKNVFTTFSGFLGLLLNRTLNFYFLIWLILFLAGVVSLALVIWGLVSVVLAAPSGTGIFRAILDAIALSNFPGPLKIGLIAMVFVAIPVMLVHLGSWALAWYLARKAEDQLDALIPSRKNSNRRSFWHYVKGLKVREAWLMIKLRLLSVLRLVSEIFLNRVRQLCYRWVLEVGELESRVIPNEIFKLRVLNVTAGENTMTPKGSHTLPGWLTTTTPAIDAIVEKASSMKTQLYLDHLDVAGERARDNLALLAACGNLTTCFNILEHLWQIHGNGVQTNQGDDAFPGDNHARDLFKDARDMWLKMQLDPYFYVNDRLPP